LAQQIDAAFVYGSVATQSDTAASDIDVLILTNALTYAEVFEALETAHQTLGRTINPTLLSRQQLKKRMKANESFLTRVMSKPKLWIIGGEDALTL
jgi:predicted nucleotidyltransferase